MTLAPVEDIRVSIPDQDGWVERDIEERCCNPECGRGGTQTHHVVRRSATGGPVRWVTVDGVVLLNERRVCLWCHDDINNHNVWIRYLTGEGWVWYRTLRSGGESPRVDTVMHPKSGRKFVKIGPLRGLT